MAMRGCIYVEKKKHPKSMWFKKRRGQTLKKDAREKTNILGHGFENIYFLNGEDGQGLTWPPFRIVTQQRNLKNISSKYVNFPRLSRIACYRIFHVEKLLKNKNLSNKFWGKLKWNWNIKNGSYHNRLRTMLL